MIITILVSGIIVTSLYSLVNPDSRSADKSKGQAGRKSVLSCDAIVLKFFIESIFYCLVIRWVWNLWHLFQEYFFSFFFCPYTGFSSFSFCLYKGFSSTDFVLIRASAEIENGIKPYHKSWRFLVLVVLAQSFTASKNLSPLGVNIVTAGHFSKPFKKDVKCVLNLIRNLFQSASGFQTWEQHTNMRTAYKHENSILEVTTFSVGCSNYTFRCLTCHSLQRQHALVS